MSSCGCGVSAGEHAETRMRPSMQQQGADVQTGSMGQLLGPQTYVWPCQGDAKANHRLAARVGSYRVVGGKALT